MLLAITALLSALFQIGYGLMRAGRLIKFIPYQVVSGYLSGVAVIIALGQLIAWLPIGALAGLLLVVAWRMFDFSMFRLALKRSTRIEFIVMATVAIVAQVGLIAASALGICLAILLFIRDQIRGFVIVNNVDLCATHSKRRRLLAATEILAERTPSRNGCA
jgi:sulfate permease, SulP family